MMDNIFGKYRVVIPKTTGSPNPAYHARSGMSFEWDYVVKVYASRPLHSQEEEAFRQHIAALNQLENPHILPIIDYGFEKHLPFYVTRYLTKGSLRERLEQEDAASSSIQDMITLIVQIGQALQYAHEHQIVHGNIKPENILFDNNNSVQLVDFHLPEKVGRVGNVDTKTVLFSYYPKQEALNEKSDQYALGSLANELFSTLLPSPIQISIPTLQQDTTGKMLTPTFSSNINETLRQVKIKLMKAMAREPEKRYKDIATFVEELQEAGTTITLPQPVTPIVPASLAPLVPVGSSFQNAITMPGYPPLLQRKQFALINNDPMPRILFIVAIVLVLGLLSSGSVWLLASGKLGRQTVVSPTSTVHALEGERSNITPQTISTAPKPTATATPHVSPSTVASHAIRPTMIPRPMPTAIPLSATISGFWNFDEGSGSIANDSSGNGHTGILHGNAGWGSPHAGLSALSLDGSYGTNVDIPTPVINTAQSFSVSAWVKVSQFNDNLDQTFVSIDGNQVSAFDLQWRSDTHKFSFTRLANDGISAESSIASALNFPEMDTWYNLVGVYNASAQTIALYVNGNLQQTVPDTNAWQASGDTEIGRALYNGRRVDFVVGEIDSVYIYQGVLTANKIASLVAAG